MRQLHRFAGLLVPSLVIALPLGAAGCSSEAPGDDPEEVVVADQDIVNGSLDSAHPAAVAYLAGGGKCTATVIATNGNNGYALTAAHCIGGFNGVIRQGQNHDSGYVEYPVVERVVHPGYTQKGPYLDFAMLRFTGAASVPPQVMPAMSPAEDNLAVGQTVTLVGYGQTQFGQTSMRRYINRPIAELSSLRLVYNQATGGQCFGDSGGPSVRATGNGDRVAGVASTVSDANPECSGVGTSARVSAVYDTFILPMMNQTGYLPQSCDECFEAVTQGGTCYSQVLTCFDNADCEAYDACIQGCNNSACVNACATAHPTGVALYENIFACVCDSQCVGECATDSLCSAVSCGFAFTDDECNACAEPACCSQMSACANDPACASCWPNCTFQSDSGAALDVCLGTSCSTECGVDPPTGTATGTGTDTSTSTDTGTGTGTGTGSGTGTGTPIAGDGADDPEGDDGGCSIDADRPASGSGWALGLALALVGLARRRRT